MADGVASRFNQVAYSAVHERHLDASAMMAGGTLLARPGKRPGPGLEVTVGGSPEAVTVQPGGGIVNGPSNGDGSYTFAIQAAVSKTLPARPGVGTSRVDLVVVRVYDADVPAFSTALREVNVEHIAGVAAATPSAPAVPMGALLIATLTVPASGSITIAPNQAYTAAAGGRLIVADTAARDAITPKWAGLEVYRLDALAAETWDGATWGDSWHTVGAGGEPAFTNGYSQGSSPIQFSKRNGFLVARGNLIKGTNASPAFTLPVGYRPSAIHREAVAGWSNGMGQVIIGTDGTFSVENVVGTPPRVDLGVTCPLW